MPIEPGLQTEISQLKTVNSEPILSKIVFICLDVGYMKWVKIDDFPFSFTKEEHQNITRVSKSAIKYFTNNGSSVCTL